MTTDTVVFVSPTFPSFTGNGLSMRAAATLQLLATWAPEVHLIVIPIYPIMEELDADIVALCKTYQVIQNPAAVLHEWPSSSWMQSLALAGMAVPGECATHNQKWQDEVDSAIEAVQPDLMFVFRFYLAQFVTPEVSSKIPVWLDIDELDSKFRNRLAQRYVLSGDSETSAQLTAEATAFRHLETQFLPSFHRIFASSGIEAKSARIACSGADIRILPNIYPKICPQPVREADGKLRLLFVGTMGYYPNLEAIAYFREDVLPLIHSRCPIPVELDVIGTAIGKDKDSSAPGVRYTGRVPNTTSFYANCDAAIVPLRIGGGTRIKILEAFSHKRPVVSTSLGAEGLEVTPGMHLLTADSASEFADRCLSLLANKNESQALAERGHEFFLAHHTLSKLESSISGLLGT
jgi:glycosyltransferase involved in cell wall biosynthesis